MYSTNLEASQNKSRMIDVLKSGQLKVQSYPLTVGLVFNTVFSATSSILTAGIAMIGPPCLCWLMLCPAPLNQLKDSIVLHL